jgi:hypothetical protein
VRKSIKHKRSEEAFTKAQTNLKVLSILEEEKVLDLYFFDESYFSLIPMVPYAWQEKGNTIAVPSVRGGYLSVAGFFSKTNKSAMYIIDNATLNSEKLIEIFDDFCSQIVRKTVVTLDNAPIHTSKIFQAKIEEWRNKGLILFFIPPYSPELNLIEILWKKIKYEWIPFKAYENHKALKNELQTILGAIGTKLYIHFT